MDNQTKLFLNEPIRLFLEMCLWEKGIRDTNEQVRADMVEDLANDFQDFLLSAIFSKLDEKYLPQWKALMDSNPTPQAVLEFLKSNLPDFDSIMEATMKEFKDIYVSA